MGRPTSAASRLRILPAAGVNQRMRRSTSTAIIGTFALPSRLVMSSLSRDHCRFRLMSCSLTVTSSSLIDWSSSFAVSNSSLVLRSSSLLERASSLADFSSSFTASCSSIMDWR